MRLLQNLLAGFAGAATLNILHQTLAHFYKDAPRVDLVGEEAVEKAFESTGTKAPSGGTLTGLTLAGDIFANTGYYAMIGGGEKKNVLLRGAGYGLAAGIGALALPEPMGLDERPVTKTTGTKMLTVALYTLGGLATAMVLKSMRK